MAVVVKVLENDSNKKIISGMNTYQSALFRSEVKSLPMLNKGKVRDIYRVDDQYMLIVTTDRISAFDVILPDPISGKGEVLTVVSNFWFNRFSRLVPNHLSDVKLNDVLPDEDERRPLEERAIIVKKLKPLPVEAIVRGYIIGSGWEDYQRTGTICGIQLPKGMQQAQRLANPIFTPSTKAKIGEHDENIDYARTVDLIGKEMADRLRNLSIKIYTEAADYARIRGIIIADTKFEFGIDDDNVLHLIDELITPDSSRFWPANSYRVGASPPSFDKQYVRDYLETLGWDKTEPGPSLPEEIINNTALKYKEARDILLS